MTLFEIKTAIYNGHSVYWKSPIYRVSLDTLGQYLITCTKNGHSIGLTHKDGKTLNGKERDFHIY